MAMLIKCCSISWKRRQGRCVSRTMACTILGKESYELCLTGSRVQRGLSHHLIGWSLKFRQEQVAIMADIKAMFHQLKEEEEEHSDYLRFVWWPQGNLEQELEPHDSLPCS